MYPIKYKYSRPVNLFSRAPITIFDDFLDLFDSDNYSTSFSSSKCPIHDIIENDKEYSIEMLLAGIKKEDISMNVENDTLIIKAERKEQKDVKDQKYSRKELFTGKYERSFLLPNSVDKENINASLVDGILKVVIPKLETDSKQIKKKIEIK